MIVDLNAYTSSVPNNFTVSNGITYFVAELGGRQLFRTDGTAAGTVLVREIVPGNVATINDSILDINGTLYFTAETYGAGTELWKTDGTTAGTVMVADIYAGSVGSSPAGFFTINGLLYFSATSVGTGRELWKSDGTAAGTVLVKDICPGACNANPGIR